MKEPNPKKMMKLELSEIVSIARCIKKDVINGQSASATREDLECLMRRIQQSIELTKKYI